MNITLDVAVDHETIVLSVGAPQDIPLGMDTAIEHITGEHYSGPVVVTPGASVQTLSTAGLFVDEDITIEPIPSNYGLITWNGSFLMVS